MCIDYIRQVLTPERFAAYCQGNVAKYMHRWQYKNGIEDVRKAHVYLGWMIEALDGAASSVAVSKNIVDFQ